MLIGRSHDLARLKTLLPETSTDAAVPVVFLDGPIGIGKTALLTSFLAEADPKGVLFARAIESPAHIPLDGLRGIVEALIDQALPHLLATGASMRTLRARLRDSMPESALIVVDDAQWLDTDSLDLLAEMLSTPISGSIRFLFVHRSSLVPERLLRAAVRGGRVVSRISLAPLEDDSARLLLQQWGSDDPAVLRMGAGNPLYLRLLADGSQGSRQRSASDAIDISEVLDSWLKIEIADLPAPARTLLHALSLTPPPPPSTLVELTGIHDGGALLEASDQLAGRGLTDPLQLEILHPLIRAAAHRDMDSTTRQRMHRIAAERMPGPVDRAMHLRELGAHLTEREVDVMLEGAAMLMSTAPRSAVKLLERTTRIPHHGRDLMLARALLIDGKPRCAEAMLRALVEADDPAKEATALLIQSLRIQGRPDEAIEVVREVPDWELHPQVAIEAATLMVMHEDTQDAALIEKAARSGSAPGVTAALSALTALAHLRQGDVRSARAPYDAARDGFDAMPASELLPVIGAVTAAGWSAHMVGDFAGGASFVQRAILLAERNGRFHALPHLYSILAFLLIPLGRIEETFDLVDKAIDAARRYDWPDVIPLATTAALVASPDRAATERWYQRLSVLDPPRTWWWRQVAALFRARVEIRLGIPTDTSVLVADDRDVFGIQKHIGLGELALREGDAAAAHAHADRARELGERFGVPYLSGQVALFQADVLLASGNGADAERAGELAVAHFSSAGAPLYACNARTWLRRLAVDKAADAVQPLTPRELVVADLVADGLSNREIAEMLHLSIRTVESHVARILRKRGLRSRAGLARALEGASTDSGTRGESR
ncbi:MAG: AAA family ATPase [Microbacterium sp.]